MNLALLFLSLLAGTAFCALPVNNRQSNGDEAALKQFLMRHNRLPYPNETVPTNGNQPEVGSWTTCQGCKLVVAEAAKIIKNPQEVENLKKTLYGICNLPFLESRKNECKMAVDDLVAGLQDMEPLLHNTTFVCQQLGYCPESIRGDISVRKRLALLLGFKLLDQYRPDRAQDVACDECIFAVSELKTMVQSKSIQDEIKQELHRFCQYAGQYQSECNAMVDQYFDLMIQELLEFLSNSKQVCVDIGFCNSKTAPSAGPSPSVVMLRRVHTRMARLQLSPVDTPTGPPKMEIFLFNLKRMQSRQGINAGCLICQEGFEKVMDALEQEESVTAISRDMTRFVCGMIPTESKPGCTNFMNTYFQELVQDLMDEYTPSQLCTGMGICKADDNYRIEQLTPNEKSAAVCDACQVVSQYLSFEFQQQDFQQEIVGVLKRACTVLPGDYSTQVRCENFVEVYIPYFLEDAVALGIESDACKCEDSLVNFVPTVLGYMADYLSRNVPCVALGMCSSVDEATQTVE